MWINPENRLGRGSGSCSGFINRLKAVVGPAAGLIAWSKAPALESTAGFDISRVLAPWEEDPCGAFSSATSDSSCEGGNVRPSPGSGSDPVK